MNQSKLMNVLVAPHFTEKAAMATDQRQQYVFKVAPDATKPQIKLAVETLFKVEVASVQVSTLKGKVKRFGRFEGRRSNTKKAYVRLKPGHQIDFTGAGE